MGKLDGLNLTGSIGNMSVFRMQGIDKVVVRSKGGVSRETIKRHPNYAKTRLNNQEWKACVAIGKEITFALSPVAKLKDYNFSGTLHALAKHIQQEDLVNEKGKRSILLSNAGFKLEGFTVNRYTSFESILRTPFVYSIDRATGSATIDVPAISPGINFFNPKKIPRYRFVCMLGHVADQVYDDSINRYKEVVPLQPTGAFAFSNWHHWDAGSESETIQLTMPVWNNQPGVSLILSGGVEFGIPLSNDVIQPVERAGAGKVLKVG